MSYATAANCRLRSQVVGEYIKARWLSHDQGYTFFIFDSTPTHHPDKRLHNVVKQMSPLKTAVPTLCVVSLTTLKSFVEFHHRAAFLRRPLVVIRCCFGIRGKFHSTRRCCEESIETPDVFCIECEENCCEEPGRMRLVFPAGPSVSTVALFTTISLG